jgi:very-short-patch-repair endonuclease
MENPHFNLIEELTIQARRFRGCTDPADRKLYMLAVDRLLEQMDIVPQDPEGVDYVDYMPGKGNE